MKPLLWPSEYLAELNKRLQGHELFETGMAFVAYPLGGDPDKASGYMWEGPDRKAHVFAQVARQVSEAFNIKMKA